MAVADVFKTIKENEVKFVDLRFTDTKGKEQHVSVPAKAFGEDKFKDGHAFDGSSIAGWKGIEASDMLLMLFFPGGLLLMGWLLVRGVNVAKWNERTCPVV